ncbi:hypothetical protein [Cyclobacterium xiamenense]|uniref:hypothetical protein n=1 Tax=Cyclobacterium xiamenense TaxID=1297121 RepID=UPI0012B6C9D0|nr:hypothetical protein [Cyclobacterium xiamenense]
MRDHAPSPKELQDRFTGFTDGLLADEVHCKQAAAECIASRYYRILENVLEVKNE